VTGALVVLVDRDKIVGVLLSPPWTAVETQFAYFLDRLRINIFYMGLMFKKIKKTTNFRRKNVTPTKNCLYGLHLVEIAIDIFYDD